MDENEFFLKLGALRNDLDNGVNRIGKKAKWNNQIPIAGGFANDRKA